MSLTEIYKLSWVVFSTTISAKNFYGATNFFLNKNFVVLKGYKSFKFFLQKIDLNFSTIIVNEGKIISFTSIDDGFIGPQMS